MTYLAKVKPMRRYRRRPAAMSGWLADMMDKMAGVDPDSQCLDQANAAVAPFEAKIDDLVRTWSPTGFYTSQDIRDLVSSTMQVVAQGQAAIDQAAAEPNASQESVMRATDDLARAGGRSLDYLQAASAADQQGIRTVNAPGFKRWITDTLATSSSALVTASVIGCIRPWWVGALAAFQSAFDVIYSLASRVVGAVITLGEVALKVPDALDDLLTIAKWGLGLGGAAWLIYEVSKAKKAGTSIL